MSEDKEEVHLGDYVELSAHRMGQVKYVGEIHGKKGIFYGVELWKGDGKHSGTFEGIEYFECYNERMGVFVIPKAILYILDVPKDYDPFKQLRLKRAAQQRKKDERNAKYSNPNTPKKANKPKNKKPNNKSRYKSNNKQSKKPKSKQNKASKPKVSSPRSKPSKVSSPRSKSSKVQKVSSPRQQSKQSKYAKVESPKNGNKAKKTPKSKPSYGRDKSDTIMSAKEFKSIGLSHLLGKGDNFDIAKRICKFYDALFNDTDTVCLVANSGMSPTYALSQEGQYQRVQSFNREGKFILVYRANPHSDASTIVTKQCFKSVIKGLALDYEDCHDVLMNLEKLFGDGCHVVRCKKISFDIYSRFSDGYECELRLPNGGDYVLAWRR